MEDVVTETATTTAETVGEAVTTVGEVIAETAKGGRPIVLIATLAVVGISAVGAGAYFGYRWLKGRRAEKEDDSTDQSGGKNIFGFGKKPKKDDDNKGGKDAA